MNVIRNYFNTLIGPYCKKYGQDGYEKSRLYSNLGSAFEYFVSILVTSNFLAALTDSIGFTSAQTNVITSFTSLGCVGQLAVMFLPGMRKKKPIILCSIFNQLALCALYFVPFVGGTQEVRIVLFAALILIGNLLLGVVEPGRCAWHITLARNGERGAYIASKECLSLLLGSIFTFGMGALFDAFKNAGKTEEAFITFGIASIVLTAAQIISLILCRERPEAVAEEEGVTFSETMRSLASATARKLAAVEVLFRGAYWLSVSYVSAYMIIDLGFQVATVTAIAAAASIARMIFQPALARLADRIGFARQMEICIALMTLGHAVMIFARPGFTAWFYVGYAVLSSVAQAGTNSSRTNLTLDYVPARTATALMGAEGALGGLVGFLLPFIVGTAIATAVTDAGNTVLGIPMYPMQLLALISTVLLAVLLVYLRTVIRPLPRITEQKN